MQKVFVYGSLRKGGGLHDVLEDCKFLCFAKTSCNYTMISLGSFPALLEEGDNSILGEIYEVNKQTLASLDRIEGHPNFYKRTKIKLEDESFVEGYVLNDRSFTENCEKVLSGNWIAFKYPEFITE